MEYWRIGLAATALRAAGDRGYDAVRSANAAGPAGRGPAGRARPPLRGHFTPVRPPSGLPSLSAMPAEA